MQALEQFELLAKAGDGMYHYFFTGGIKITMIVLCLLSLLFGAYNSIKGRRKKITANKKDIILAASILLFSFLLYQYGLEAKDHLTVIFPKATLVIMGILSLIMLVQEAMFLFAGPGIPGKSVLGPPQRKRTFPFLRIAISLALTVGYMAILEVLGFYASSFLFFWAFTLIFCTDVKAFCRRMHIQIAIPAGLVIVLYSLFSLLLNVSLPRGLLF